MELREIRLFAESAGREVRVKDQGLCPTGGKETGTWIRKATPDSCSSPVTLCHHTVGHTAQQVKGDVVTKQQVHLVSLLRDELVQFNLPLISNCHCQLKTKPYLETRGEKHLRLIKVSPILPQPPTPAPVLSRKQEQNKVWLSQQSDGATAVVGRCVGWDWKLREKPAARQQGPSQPHFKEAQLNHKS